MNRKIIIFATIFLILALAFIYLKRGQGVERNLPIFSADSTEIGSIELINPSAKLTLKNDNGTWRISSPVKWDANIENVRLLFQDALAAKSAKIEMTTSPDAVERYGLTDKKALQIKTFSKNGKLIDHVYFNPFNSNWDYFRYQGSDKIFQMTNLISNRFSPDLSNWRSPVLLRIFETEISSIDVSYPDNKYSLIHQDNKWIYKDAKQSFDIHPENRPLLRALNILNNLDTGVFYDGANSDLLPAFESPLCTVIVNQPGGKSRKLEFARTERTREILMMDDQPSPIYGIVNDTILRFTIAPHYYKILPYSEAPQAGQ